MVRCSWDWSLPRGVLGATLVNDVSTRFTSIGSCLRNFCGAPGGDVKQGLLSYALVHEGLELGEADFQSKGGKILTSEWLAYRTQEVPELFSDRNAKGAIHPTGASGNTHRT
jgi:hypothetical protein